MNENKVWWRRWEKFGIMFRHIKVKNRKNSQKVTFKAVSERAWKMTLGSVC